MPQSAVSFSRFGGLRLDLPLDEVGGEQAIYLRDVDWKNSTGTLRSRDGFEKGNSEAASGEYKGLFPHSNGQLLAVKRVSSESVKLVALNTALEEKHETAWTTTKGKSTFARFGTPSASYTYARCGGVDGHAVIRYNGSEFKEAKATVDGEAEKQFPRGDFMIAWPDGDNRLVIANTASKGGPNEAESSASHVWFSEPGNAEAYESTAYAQLSPGDGEEIVGMCVWDGKVFVFKETQFFVFYGVTTDDEGKPEFLFDSVQLGAGARVSRSTAETLEESSDQICCATPNGVYFCCTDGVYLTTGGPPVKISGALAPLEEQSEFEGPMATFLSGSTEAARWPAAGITFLGRRLFVKRYEYLFPYDLDEQEWLAWKMPNVSMAVWGRSSSGEALASTEAPGTVANDSSAGGKVWTEPSNAKASDDSRASVLLNASNTTSQYLKATNFGFEIPEGATINGIVASVEGYASAVMEHEAVKIVKGGTLGSTNKAGSKGWPLAFDQTVTFGGSTDLWGEEWTVANINAEGFGVAIKARAVNPFEEPVARVDQIQLTVYYTLKAEEAEGIRPRLFVTNGKYIYWTGPEAEEEAGSRSPEWQSGFYDVGSADEKSLVLAKMAGEGAVNMAVAKDFGQVGTSTEFDMGEEGTSFAIHNKSQTGTLFSHRLSGTAPWEVQRLARYLRENRAPGSKS